MIIEIWKADVYFNDVFYENVLVKVSGFLKREMQYSIFHDEVLNMQLCPEALVVYKTLIHTRTKE